MTTQLSHRGRFNLAIEMLVISGCKSSAVTVSANTVSISQSRCLSFQVATTHAPSYQVASKFQSRNRDACHFRELDFRLICRCLPSFNLAIEMLVISGPITPELRAVLLGGFNLAIEMLVISGLTYSSVNPRRYTCFNLAIEMLVISGRVM